jgi:CheY-like chemotaxis protein
MPDPHANEQATLPAAFIEQVQQILCHLHDFPYLLGHPLALTPASLATQPVGFVGQQLRLEVMHAIESLSPGPGVSFRAPHARLYNVLHLHYVEGMTITEAASELSISLRQAYRDLRRGEESIAALLWVRLTGEVDTNSHQGRGTHTSSGSSAALEAEMQRLEDHTAAVNLRQLVERAHKAVERLAHSLGITCQLDMPEQAIMVSTDPVVAQQVLVSVLSHAIQLAQPGFLTLMLTAGDVSPIANTGTIVAATVLLRFSPKPGTQSAPMDTAITQLCVGLGWLPPQVTDTGNMRSVLLRVAAMQVDAPTLLVIDDNTELIDLFSRYLAGQPCRVIQATCGPEGLHMAQQLRPDAIVLDVMMPEVDGWEVLQTLRAGPATADIPVIVCSVISDPQLALSLGACASLPKPVSRDDVLRALHTLQLI